MSFEAKLREKKKGIKTQSVDTYLRNIRRLRRAKFELPIPPASHTWLLDKKLFTWVDNQPLSIRRHMTTAAQVALGVYGKESDKWKDRQKTAMKLFDADRAKRILTPKQKARIPSRGFASLKRVIRNMKKELAHVLNSPVGDWSFSDLRRVQELVIVAVYENFPLRLDYATLETEKTGGNCLFKQLKKPRGWHVQLTTFKTDKSLGKQLFKFNAANQRLLNKFVPAVKRLTTHGFFLSNANKGKLSKQGLSKRLMATTKKRIGRSFSTQLIRVLFAMQNRDVIESASEVSKKLLHSATQSLQYAKKSKP